MTANAANFRSTRPFLGWRIGLFYAAVLVASLPIWPFSWHLALHVAGAAMLIGNAVVMAVWLSVAGFAGSDDAKRRAAHAVNRADLWFTVPGAVLILANGLAMVAARYGGPASIPSIPWIAGGLVLLVLTGLVWALRLVPTQLAMQRLATASGALDAAGFRRLLVRWSVWGTIATVLPVLAVFLMTTKPTG
jgi:uncharacterized membrane protein